ncbi:MAG: integral rane sensor signal transduction histidine kinase [Bacteroidetes bacterium]|nr:integral rane sensor signal transduction histidine kinase [Bacteroidota bacterium]
MNIYTKKQRWKLVLAALAFLIVIASLWYTNNLVKRIRNDEKKKVELWAKAVQKKAKLVKFTNELFEKIKAEERKKAELYAEATRQLSGDLKDPSFVLKVLQENTTVPVILTNEKDELFPTTASRNLDSLREKDTVYLRQQLNIMKALYPPMEVEVYKGIKQRLYHKDSRVFTDIQLVFDSLTKSFMDEVAVNSAAVPVIYTDSSKTKVIEKNDKIDVKQIDTPDKLKNTLNDLSGQNEPIKIILKEGEANYIFYAESELLTKLRLYPYVQFGVIGLFLLIAYILFSTARKAEQDQVWVGMSKETAHQLGTPLSSLMAWNEHLRGLGVDENIVNEMQRDVKRLDTITDRFSKIGSQPTLTQENVNDVLKNAVEYLKSRTSRNVTYHIEMPSENLQAQLCVPLFEWVIENLCKNAVDAMNGKGEIWVKLKDIPEGLIIDIRDTGKGIPKSKFKTVFEPGFTTKQRGWGLGLSLTKRIIENYHEGKIYVLNSEINKGTTFRIEMKRF